MERETFAVAPLGCNCSILFDTASLDATVVDPGSDVTRVLAFLLGKSLRLRQIVVTHGHLDHIAGAKSLSDQTGAPVFFHQADLFQLAWMEQQAQWMGVPTPVTGPPDESAEDGMAIQVGEEKGVVLHTPGHTGGSISLYFPESSLLVAGDTLFRGGVGRTDLPGGNAQVLQQSIQEKLLPLPEETLVITGHGELTTIGHERNTSRFF